MKTCVFCTVSNRQPRVGLCVPGPRIGYLDREIEKLAARIADIPDDAHGDWKTLNGIFLSVLKGGICNYY